MLASSKDFLGLMEAPKNSNGLDDELKSLLGLRFLSGLLLRRATTNSFAGDAVVDVEVSSSDTSEMAAMQGVRCFPMEVTDLLSLWPQANDANMKSMLL